MAGLVRTSTATAGSAGNATPPASHREGHGSRRSPRIWCAGQRPSAGRTAQGTSPRQNWPWTARCTLAGPCWRLRTIRCGGCASRWASRRKSCGRHRCCCSATWQQGGSCTGRPVTTAGCLFRSGAGSARGYGHGRSLWPEPATRPPCPLPLAVPGRSPSAARRFWQHFGCTVVLGGGKHSRPHRDSPPPSPPQGKWGKQVWVHQGHTPRHTVHSRQHRTWPR